MGLGTAFRGWVLKLGLGAGFEIGFGVGFRGWVWDISRLSLQSNSDCVWEEKRHRIHNIQVHVYVTCTMALRSI